MKGSGGSFNANIAAGRLLCDTYLSAKEFLRETTYRSDPVRSTGVSSFHLATFAVAKRIPRSVLRKGGGYKEGEQTNRD